MKNLHDVVNKYPDKIPFWEIIRESVVINAKTLSEKEDFFLYGNELGSFLYILFIIYDDVKSTLSYDMTYDIFKFFFNHIDNRTYHEILIQSLFFSYDINNEGKLNTDELKEIVEKRYKTIKKELEI